LRLSEDCKIKSLKISNKEVEVKDFELMSLRFENKIHSISDSVCTGSRIENDSLVFNFTHKDVDWSVRWTASEKYLDLIASLKSKTGYISEVNFPAKLVFDADDIDELKYHINWPRNMGLELNKNFFKPQNNIYNPHNFNFVVGKPNQGSLHELLYGHKIPLLPLSKESPIRVGKDAKNWLGIDIDRILKGLKARTARPLSKKSADISIFESDDGVWLGGTRFGGKGVLFRIGGNANTEWKNETLPFLYYRIYRAAKDKAKAMKMGERVKFVMVLPVINGNDFRNILESCSEWFHRMGNDVNVIFTPRELANALKSPDTLMIVNPLGEDFLLPEGMDGKTFMAELKKFVQAGGVWFESRNYPFFALLEPQKYLKITGVPVADLNHFKLKGENVAIYSVQPVADKNFKKDKPLCSFQNTYSGCDKGAMLSRKVIYYLDKGESAELPVTRIKFGENFARTVKSFCADNKITKKLSDKASPEFLEKFKNALIIKCSGNDLLNTKDVIANMPDKSLIHLANYLTGGFDKQYPDHLPPRKNYGTADEFRDLIDFIHSRGSLFMPYTNNTWWCDEPKGPTFEKHGDAPLVVRHDGKLQPEIYWNNKGFTCCQWHPAVLEANAKIIKEFTQDYPADIVFQDQTGSRFYSFDANPAAPSKNSYADGLVNTTMIDSKKALLSTEDGFSHLSDYEIQFCGFSFGILEPKPNNYWRLIYENYPKNTFKLYNMLGALFQDKVSITQHNLGGDIREPRRLSLCVAYGMHLITRINRNDKTVYSFQTFEWIKWLDVVQKTLSAKYIGANLKNFEHTWENLHTRDASGVIRSQYDNISIVANLQEKTLREGNMELPSNSFYAKGKDFSVGGIIACGDFKVNDRTWYALEGNSLKIYGKGGEEVVVPVNKKIHTILFKDKKIDFEKNDCAVKFKLPDTTNSYRQVWSFELK